MKNLIDKNGRTIWFDGQPGKLKPSCGKSRVSKIGRKSKATTGEDIKHVIISKTEDKTQRTTDIKIEHNEDIIASGTATSKRANKLKAPKLKTGGKRKQDSSTENEVAENKYSLARKRERKCKTTVSYN